MLDDIENRKKLADEQQFNAYWLQAEQMWHRADGLEVDLRLAQKVVSQWQTQYVMTAPGARLAAKEGLSRAQDAHSVLRSRLGDARLEAFKATELASALKWGVRLGRAYRATRAHSGTSFFLRVSFLRTSQGEPGRLLCLGEDAGVTHLLVLGRDELTFTPDGAENVVSLQAFRDARQGR